MPNRSSQYKQLLTFLESYSKMTKEEKIKDREEKGLIDPNCPSCELFYEDPDAFAPKHKASKFCESGKRPHCTCDRCF